MRVPTGGTSPQAERLIWCDSRADSESLDGRRFVFDILFLEISHEDLLREIFFYFQKDFAEFTNLSLGGRVYEKLKQYF